jgi:hypothetical protein
MNRGLFLLGVAFMVSMLLPHASWAVTLSFINEVHYDNAGSDVNEGVEIAGPAGVDLSSWSLLLYNGSDGLAYKTQLLSGIITDQQNSFGVIWFPISGMQNGSPDGIALIDSTNMLIQFLSYEGGFTATDGPAAGITATEISVREDNPAPAVGNSLQLIGSGSDYSDFAWSGPMTQTIGAINSGQSFLGSAAAIPEPSTLSIMGLGLLGLVFRKNRKLFRKNRR